MIHFDGECRKPASGPVRPGGVFGRRRPRRGEAGLPALHLGAERPRAVELAQDADRSQGHPVDQQVGRGQIELTAELGRGGAGVAQADGLRSQPVTGEAELLGGDRTEERREVPEEVRRADLGRRQDETLGS